MKAKSALQRIEDHTLQLPCGGCWLWEGARTGGKRFTQYGQVTVQVAGGKHREGAHRYAYRHLVGPIPDDMHVLHRCDIPNCVNPAHLFLGTDSDNTQDRLSKGRGHGATSPRPLQWKVRIPKRFGPRPFQRDRWETSHRYVEPAPVGLNRSPRS